MPAKLLLVAVFGLLVSACSSGPRLNVSDADTKLTPSQAAASAADARVVAWGGVVVNTTHEKNSTLIEIVAYPLGFNHKPDTDGQAIGRFLAEHPGFLETIDYAPGRLVTVVGPLRSTRQGRIGESDYTYPVVGVREIKLWPAPRQIERPHWNFGIGVILH
jgi:outer membrane lipoprotein